MRLLIVLFLTFSSMVCCSKEPKIEFKDLFAPVSDFKQVVELDEWDWLIQEKYSPMLITAFGDIFFQTKGGIYFLDTYAGKKIKIANDRDEFKQSLNSNNNIDLWFMPGLRIGLYEAQINLKAGEVYSAKKPTSLGGKYVVENFSPINWKVHYSLSGQLHEQLSKVPVGTKINNIQIKSE